MSLRTLILWLLLAVGTLPLSLLMALQLPSMVRIFEQASEERIEHRLQEDHQRLSLLLTRRQESLRFLRINVGSRDLVSATEALPAPLLRRRLARQFSDLFDEEHDVQSLRLFDADGREQLHLARREEGLCLEALQPREAQLADRLTAIPAEEAVTVLAAVPRSPGHPAIQLTLATRIPASSPERRSGYALLEIDLGNQLRVHGKHLLITGSGDYLSLARPGISALEDFPGLAANIAQGRQGKLLDTTGGRPHFWRPLLQSTAVESTLWIGCPLDRGELADWLHGLAGRTTLIVLALVLPVLLLARWAAGRAERLRCQLMDILGRLLAGHALAQTPWQHPRELRLLGEELGKLAASRQRFQQEQQRHEEQRVALQAQLVQIQKLEAAGKLAAAVARDFNKILATISGHSQIAQARRNAGQVVDSELAAIRQATDRASQLSRQLLFIARKEAPQVARQTLRDLITAMEQLLDGLLGDNIRLRLELADDPLTITADGSMIEQLLLNLVLNARDAMPLGEEIVIRSGRRRHQEGRGTDPTGGRLRDYAMFSVSDSGDGMDQSLQQRIFEPFFTTKVHSCGSGLGLAAAQAIVAMHQGWIEVASSPGRGSTFTVYLPADTSSG
ncbi:MAG: hypothetical protein BWK76_04645 [Desulfobulbaceae bacterium A2]|nr:MAG: hypothetical protein BWK76_04645 [Desulfobulbaceae bacterium A2]